MTTDQNLEKIYQLVEQFDFDELPDAGKSFVLTQMSGNEYRDMRETIKDSKKYFAGNPEIQPDDSILKSISNKYKKNNFIRTLNYPLQFYKVAASILIILGITFMVFYKSNPGIYSQLAIHDTVYIRKTDTVISKIKDTIQIVKSIIIYSVKKSETISSKKLLADITHNADCSKEICPSDVERITSLTGKNNISRDSFLTDFVVSVK
jgi:hypothetical protein